MAKHLSELRAIPVFMYGQSYILAVEAWMAAPLFVLFGVSATVLKLPLLCVNLAVVLLVKSTNVYSHPSFRYQLSVRAMPSRSDTFGL
jgi:hypothetical protein